MKKAREADIALARRLLARRRLLHFTKATFPGEYEAGWVHEDICMRLERFSRQITERKSPRLMLLMPPRHGKSELASIRLPAWHLGHNPTHEIIDVGYNLDLPMGFSRKVREVARLPVYRNIFPGMEMSKESQAIERWMTTAGGAYMAAGVGGGITGKGAHMLIVDDPLKNDEEASNPLNREKLWNWYQSTAYTRLAPGGGVLVIETWWNDDDLAGRLQLLMNTTPEADQFEIIKYPALSEAWEYRDEDSLEIIRSEHELTASETDGRDLTLLRPPDTCLHEARYDTEALKKVRANLQPRIWSALYQQNPVPDEGMFFKQEYFVTQHGAPELRGCQIYTAWDFAVGLKQQNDWTVGATIARDSNNRMYLIDVHRFRGDTYQIVEAMIQAHSKWGGIPETSYLVGVENGQIWQAVRPVFEQTMRERHLVIPYEPLQPMTDKMMRARPLQGIMQMKQFVFDEDIRGFFDIQAELLRFPSGAHDDIVDALSWVVRLAMMFPAPWKPPAKQPKSWKDEFNSLSVGGSHMAA